MSTDAKQCPHCGQWALKDAACSYIFACGLADDGNFYPGAGCGRPWCWICGKKYCGQHRDPQTGAVVDPRTSHNENCCKASPDYVYEEYCQGPGHAHCSRQPIPNENLTT